MGKNSEALPDPYAVIELKVDKKLYSSPCASNWLEGVSKSINKDRKELIVAETCHWPLDEGNLSDLLLQKSKPKENWLKLKRIRVLAFCVSLNKAKAIAEKAMDGSDFSNNEELPTKRKRIRTTKFQAGPLSSSDDDESSARPKLPALTINNNQIAHCRALSFSPKTRSGTNVQLLESVTSALISSRAKSSDHSQASLSGCKPVATLSGGSKPVEVSGDKANKNLAVSPFQSSSNKSSPKSSPFIARVGAKSPFKLGAAETVIGRQLLTAINLMQKEAAETKKMIYAIYCTVCNPGDLGGLEEDMPQLPLSSTDTWAKFESVCDKDEKKLAIVKYLAEFGGRDLRCSVFNIMAKVLTNNFAMNYNLTGTNRKNVSVEKQKFQDTLPYTVVKGAVKLHVKLAKKTDASIIFNSDQFDSSVSDWLKDAKKRFDNEEAKKKKVEDKARKRTIDEVEDSA